MRHNTLLIGLFAALTLPVVAQAQFLAHTSGAPATSNRPEATPPAETITTRIAGQDVDLWPYTGEDFVRKSDPINLVFLGDADPRQIRAALLTVSGDRSAYGLPNVFPFNCTWADAAGNTQPSYAGREWASGSIQLQCGEYTVLRTHLRFFRFKNFTLGGAHFELMAPGTALHFSLSWDFAEKLVVLDLLRSGHATLVGVTDVINPTPTYGTIEPYIYPAIPAGVKAVLGLTSPAKPNGDGRATILRIAGGLPVETTQTEVTFVYPYKTPAPKPFCNAGGEYVYVQGPLDFVHRVTIDDQGEYRFDLDVTGTLSVTPIDIATGAPIGPPVDVTVRQRQHAVLTDGMAWGEDVKRQTLHDAVEQSLFEKLRAGNQERYEYDVDCSAPQ